MTTNGYGFDDAVNGEGDFALPTPKPKHIDPDIRRAGQAAAAESGLHRHAPVQPPTIATDSTRAPGRVRLTTAAPRNIRFQREARVQLNILAPVPIALRWRGLSDSTGVAQWELLEMAIAHLRERLGLSPEEADGAD